MAIEVTNQISYLLEGDLNAGMRVFARHSPRFILEGLADGAADRLVFVKDYRLLTVTGQAPVGSSGNYVGYHAIFNVDSPVSYGRMAASLHSFFRIEGHQPGYALLAMSGSNTFIIENVTPESAL
ncbi:hypothetical protein RPALISO_13 [Ruegeria phage RpAliso]|nr:hypothetical protein RPALISO_13 [Ruegeria phage RpAliso]